jgi:hypothetical protein
MGEPSGGVRGDGPLSCFATKTDESCADERETYEERDGSEFATDGIQIEHGAHRKYESEEKKHEFSGE